MSAIISFKDKLTPALQQKLDQISDKGPILEAMGGAAASISMMAFDNTSLLLKKWAPKKDGSVATLKSNPDPQLCKSLLAMPPSGDMIEVGTNRPYARAQNFGYEPHNLPARPFFPFAQDSTVLAAAEKAIVSAMTAAVEKALK